MKETPNVNFFIHSVPYLKGLGINHELVKKYLKERLFYSCNQKYNFVSYVNDGSKTNIDFVAYSGNNEKSDGLFNQNGLCDSRQISELRQNLRETKSPIWHGLITFEENFGKTNCNTYEKSYELMKTLFPRFLKSAKFDPNNIEWFAGFHTNTDNRHIHFAFYEKEPIKYRKNSEKLEFSHPQVSVFSMEQMKIRTEVFLTDLNSKLVKQRKELAQTFKDSIPTLLKKGEILKSMKKLFLVLPSGGRVSYDSENMMFLKNDINYLVDLILKSNSKSEAVYKSFLTLLLDKDSSIRRMCAASKIDPDKVVLFNKYHNDLYRRLGNIVIKEILQINRELKNFEFKTNNRLAKKRINRNKLKFSIQQSLYLSEKVQKEATNYFIEHMKVLEEMRIKVLIEQGVIEI